MDISEFDYDLPPEAIAQYPLPERDHSRLLVLSRAEQRIKHTRFDQLPTLLSSDRDFLVFNNTKVFPARLVGTKMESGGRVELLLLRELETGRWEALLKPYARIREGNTLCLAEGHLHATVIKKQEGKAEVVFSETSHFWDQLLAYGQVPLPPYIHRKESNQDLAKMDWERYQTIYATTWGSVAAPTAGLHFSPRLFDQLEAKGIERLFLTLHVGPGTFLPVRTERVEEHRMETEFFVIPPETAERINQNKREGKRLIAVGTTTTRALESAALSRGLIRAWTGQTDLFIYPGYHFQVVDSLLTNFHLPRSTLLMLVSAFAGKELIKKAYQEAITHGYRFYSYGDAMLIL